MYFYIYLYYFELENLTNFPALCNPIYNIHIEFVYLFLFIIIIIHFP